MRVEVGRRREGALVGVEVQDRVALDQEVDSDRASAPVGAEEEEEESRRLKVNSRTRDDESDYRDSRPHVHVALAVLRLILAIHAAEALRADDLAAKEAERWIGGHLVASLALALQALRRQRVELLWQTDELVDGGMLERWARGEDRLGESEREGGVRVDGVGWRIGEVLAPPRDGVAKSEDVGLDGGDGGDGLRGVLSKGGGGRRDAEEVQESSKFGAVL